MDLTVGDLLTLKKPHPCGGATFALLRVGIDLKIKCTTCGREWMAPRAKIEKSIKYVTRG